MNSVLAYIGVFAPIILNIISVLLLFNKHVYLFFYIIGSVINIILNFILKMMIKDPRPNQDIILFNLGYKHGKRFSIDKYGMPSGHSQIVGFSTSFICLVLQNNYIALFYFIISMITMFQRYEYKNHTFSQIIIGFCIGIIMGYIFYVIAGIFLKGNIQNKKDDNCFLC